MRKWEIAAIKRKMEIDAADEKANDLDIIVSEIMVMIWRTLDLSPLAYLIPSVAAEVATGTGFYYSKAKVENRIKLMRQNKVTPNETHFSENY